GAAIDASALHLGTLAAVEGGSVAGGPNGPAATAATVRLARLAVGPVAAVDVGARTLEVLGQTVQVDGSTVFDAALRGGLAAVRVGDVVSVHALADAGGHPLATRIEPAAAGEPWRLRGYVSAVDAGARRLSIGAATLDYAGAAAIPDGLAVGSFVQLRLAGTSAGGVFPVAAFVPVAAPADAGRVEVEGLVAAPTAQGFRIGALAVDASAATIVPGNAELVAGAHAEVEGRLQAGTLVADRVTLLAAQQADRRSYRIAGTLTALDAPAQSFVVRGVGVDFSAANFVGGSAGSLVPGASVVQVVGPLSADGTQLRATQVLIR
ncbi:MAG TPA: DUF5666 domain-containing protein, partial [Ideonella sp.]|nr:DUF5666 domain-containing protein [Ideonella sp.]